MFVVPLSCDFFHSIFNLKPNRSSCLSVSNKSAISIPDKEVLFSDLNFAISKGQKLGLVGNNGCGKSTLLQIIAGQLSPSSGVIVRPDDIYYIPQHFGQYDSLTIAQALRIDRKQQALQAILTGDASTENFNQLDDDWNIEERSIAALDSWGLGQFPLSYPMHLLSGGEKDPCFSGRYGYS